MTKDIILLTIFCIVGYLIFRIFIELSVYLYCSKKEYKAYKQNTKFAERYFLTWIKKKSKKKYLKSENRNIKYPVIMSIYFYTHIINFISLSFIFVFDILVAIKIISINWAEIALFSFLIENLLSFAVVALVINYEHRNYYKKRRRRKM